MEQGSELGVEPLEDFESLLKSDKAKTIYKNVLKDTHFGDLSVRFLGRTVKVQNKGDSVSKDDVEWFAGAFTECVNKGLIEEGVLAMPAIEMDLVPVCSVCQHYYATLTPRPVEEEHAACIEQHGSAPPPLEYRKMMLVYPFSRLSREELNEKMGWTNFVEEGQVPPLT